MQQHVAGDGRGSGVPSRTETSAPATRNSATMVDTAPPTARTSSQEWCSSTTCGSGAGTFHCPACLTDVQRCASDTATLKTKLQSFVSAYKDILDAGHTATGYSGTKATNPVLAGERSIRSALDQFARIAGSQVPGARGAYTTLGSVGVKLAANGTRSG
jgi:hypothetical protein